MSDKRRCVEPESCGLSIVRQCELLGLPRSTYYYELATESAENLELMSSIWKRRSSAVAGWRKNSRRHGGR